MKNRITAYICLLFFICSSLSLHSSSDKKNNSLLDEIKQRKLLRVGVRKNYIPFHIEDAIPDSPGFDVELAMKYADFLGVELEIIPLGEAFQEHEAAILEKKIDLSIAAFHSNLNRIKRISFSDYYILASPSALVDKSHLPPEPEGNIVSYSSFTSLNDLETEPYISFSTKKGSGTEYYLKKRFPRAEIYSYESIEDALDALLKGKVSAFAAPNLYIEAILQQKRYLRSQYLPLTKSVLEEHISIGMPQNDIELSLNINAFLKELRLSGFLNDLYLKYFKSNVWVKVINDMDDDDEHIIDIPDGD